jgi:hypothetical protein
MTDIALDSESNMDIGVIRHSTVLKAVPSEEELRRDVMMNNAFVHRDAVNAVISSKPYW